MIYTDALKKKYKKQFVLIVDMNPEILCMGVYDNYYEAAGTMMNYVWEFADSYKDKGDEFRIGLPEETANGESLLIEFKKACWSHGDWERFHILHSYTMMSR